MESESATPVEESTTAENNLDSAPEQTEDQSIDTSTDTPTEQDDGAEPSNAEKRIKQLVSKRKAEEEARRRAEQEAAYWRGKAEAKATPPATPPEASKLAVPKIENFDSYESYEQAKEEYILKLAEVKIQQRLEEHAKKLEAEKNEAIANNEQKSFRERLSVEHDKEDLFRIINDQTLQVSPAMGKVIKNSKFAAQLLRHLDNNREWSAKVAAMPPLLAASELGELVGKLQAKSASPARKVSQAPAPIQTVKASGSPVVKDEDLPIAEFIRRRNKNMRR